MKAPEVTINNIPEVYGYFRDNPVNQPIVHGAHALLGKAVRTEISLWTPDAEEYLSDRISDGAQVVFAANHRSSFDQFVLAALPAQLECLRPMIGNTFIPTRIDEFNGKSWRAWGVTQLGAIPAYRGKDFPSSDDPRRELAKDGLIDDSVHRIVSGQHMAGFWEGTRNPEKPLEVQAIQRGVGEIVCKAAEAGVDLLVLPMGYVYEAQEPKEFTTRKLSSLSKTYTTVMNWIHPTLHVGKPLEGEALSTDAGAVIAQLRPAMQNSLDTAYVRQQQAT